ncbi:hypothetical protein JCM19240_1572 [Vibrio maritimus]|uniref:Prepilin-type N-terminal cleavage/methylation domain-containing protein n=1 Tax=Vibrio maritimus TaxID=990268 RepID=A0A090T826_9VIBR|nr:hypothetical protein JCM19240_1572 [Vibrio maritimus]
MKRQKGITIIEMLVASAAGIMAISLVALCTFQYKTTPLIDLNFYC